MDPTFPQTAEPPKDFKTQVADTSKQFVSDHYEGFLHKLVGVIYTILNFLKNSIVSMINMAFGRE